jgi:uridine kinase
VTPSAIHVTGASGSGTSTLGQTIARSLGFRFLDADAYFWQPTTPPYRTKRDRAERVRLLRRDFRKPVVLSGSIVGWDDTLENAFDLIVYLWVPTDVRLDRLKRRELDEVGSIDPAFLDWAAAYDTGDVGVRSRALHERWLGGRECPVLRVEGTPSLEHAVERVLGAIRHG